jgi:fatty acid desaturase
MGVQRSPVETPTTAPRRLSEVGWPTLGVAFCIYAGWAIVTFESARLPAPLLAVLGGWLIAWHGSLQHEVIHGHPTPWRRLNHALAMAPLSLWLPFARYRQSHLAHHATDALTDPDHDPESRYIRPGAHDGPSVERTLAMAQASLLGRLVLGPPVEVARFLLGDARALMRGEPAVRRAWVAQALLLAPVLLWLHFACHLSLLRYVVCFVYPGVALSLLRSFAEHRADPDPARRVAVVERAPVLGVLFLNNNLHVAHHAWPGAPWFRLGGLYATHRERLLSANGGLVYNGYADVARRFLLRPHDSIQLEPAPSPPILEGSGY